jgi:hypothetical protein
MKPVRHDFAMRHLFQCLALFASLCLLSGPGSAAESASATGKPAISIPDVSKLSTDPHFKLNTLPTTKYGPAWADILIKPSNFLSCNNVAIALCYYSGAGANTSTPCTTDGGGISNCTCYEIAAGKPYFVDINAILNLDVYKKTVKICGHDGSKCKPTGKHTAPVCESIKNNTLMPGADLVSTFSLALEKEIPIKETSCTTPAPYAGCMTAPCKRTGKTDSATGLPLVQCACPNYTGPFQVGTEIQASQCSPGNNMIWSAGYTPGHVKTMPGSK